MTGFFGDRSQNRSPITPHKRAVGPLLLCAMVLGFAATAHAQPFPSFLLDTTRYIGPDLKVAGGYVALAGSKTGGMVIWTRGSDRRVLASRLTRSMDVVDSIPLDMMGPWNDSYSAPAVACSDSGYAVAWQGVENDPYGVTSISSLWLALVSTNGEVVNRVPLDTEVQVHSLAVAARSDRYALACYGRYPSSQREDIRAIEVALDGTILRQCLVARGGPTNPLVGAPDVARGDSAYLVVWQGQDSTWEHYDVNARFIWPDDSSADTTVIFIRHGAAALSPKVAFDGENFWVAWLETTPSAETLAKVARVTQSGVVLDTGGIVVGTGAASVVLAAARETTLVALHVGEDVITSMRYDTDGQLLDSTPVLLSTHAVGHLEAAVVADTFLVVWRDEVEGVSESQERLAGRRITASGTVVDPDVRDYAFSANNHYERYAAIASDGENFLAVWSDERAVPDFSARLLGRRFNNQGRFLDAEPFTITDPYSRSVRPVLTYGAGCYLLSWFVGYTATYAVRISRQGEVMDPVPIPLPSSTCFAATGATFLRDSMFVIVGGDTCTGSPEVVRLMADGRVLDSVPRILKVRWGEGMANRKPSIASIGDTLVMACRLESANVVTWLALGLYDRKLKQYDSIWWRTKPNYRYPYHRTSVAYGGGRILVAMDPNDRIYKPELWLLDSVGHLLRDTLSLPCVYVWGINFSIAYDGANFLCAKSSSTYPWLPAYRFSPDGDLLDIPAVFLVAFESTLVTGDCALARDSLGHVGLAFFTFESQGCMSSRARAAVFPRLTGGIESPRTAADLNRLQVSPNPSTGIVWLKLAGSAGESQTIAVRDVAGRVRTVVSLSPASADRGRTMLDLRQLPAGVYFLETAGGRRCSKLVIARPGGVP